MPRGFADLGRFSEPALLILISLAGGPKHGYAMTDDIEQMTGERLGPGTLYGALSRLEERGLIEALPQEQRRQPFRITAVGQETLRAQIASLEAMTLQATRRLAAT